VVGKHDGPLGDLPATGKEIDITAVTIDRFDGNLIAEEWELFDEMLMMRQLGIVEN
jgi:predicted ester cyclase